MRIYLAGPLFSAAEQFFNAQLRDRLVAAGHEVWLPQEQEPRERTAAAIFQADVNGLVESDVVVANMDGPDPDSGTAWECGYAYGKKPIILFRTDFRKVADTEQSPFNLMLSESADVVIDAPLATVAEVTDRIVHALGELQAAGHPREGMP